MKEQVVKFKDCDFRCYAKQVKSRSGTPYDRAYCGKVDKKCKIADSSPRKEEIPIWQLPIQEWLRQAPKNMRELKKAEPNAEFEIQRVKNKVRVYRVFGGEQVSGEESNMEWAIKNLLVNSNIHRDAVMSAQARGEKIPIEVLNDYPKMQKSVKPTQEKVSTLLPMPKLPPIDTRPKRFYKDREYIGITFKKEEHGEWIESLSIKRLMGRPYNVYDYKVTIEYNQPMWDALIKRIKSEATVYGREAIVKPGYAYTVARIISRPMKRSWVRLEPHEWRATDFPGGNNEYFQKLSGRGPWELSLSQYIDAFMMYHKPDWVGEGEVALKLAEKQWKEAIKKEIPTGRVHPVVLKEYEKMAL